MKKKKRKMKNITKLIMLIMIAVIILLIYEILNKDIKEVTKPKEDSKTSVVFTSNEEQNKEEVAEYFADSIGLNDYKKAIEKTSNYVKETGDYNEVEFTFDDYYHYTELEKIYKTFNNSDIVKLEIIGQSVDKRNIYSLEIGTGKEVTMFTAGVHAAEMASTMFITKFMTDLINDYENGNEEAKELLKKYKIVIVPSVNPDGYETVLFGYESIRNKDTIVAKEGDIDLLWRFRGNANSVDLNRNFPTQTSGLYYSNYTIDESLSIEPTMDIKMNYPGEVIGMEPETKAVMYWQNKHLKNAKVYADLHTAGRIIYNGRTYFSDEYNEIAKSCAKLVSEATGYKVLEPSDDPAGNGIDGNTVDYAAELINGYVYSTKTNRLSTDFYGKQLTNKPQNTCVLTIESMERYSIELYKIENEYYEYNLKDAYMALIKR